MIYKRKHEKSTQMEICNYRLDSHLPKYYTCSIFNWRFTFRTAYTDKVSDFNPYFSPTNGFCTATTFKEGFKQLVTQLKAPPNYEFLGDALAIIS